MKLIKLTRGYFAKVSDCDYDLLIPYKWHVSIQKYNIYAETSIIINGVRKKIRMHRMILNPKKGQMVDHIDHDGLNNQRCNIRVCNASQNQQNVKPRGRIKYLGVSVHRSTRKYKSKKTGAVRSWISRERYIAHIKTKEKYIHLGLYDTPEEAALAYNKAAAEYHKEYARLNVIPLLG